MISTAMHLAHPKLFVESVLELDAEDLRRNGVSCLLLDVDCTLKDHGSAELNPGVSEWLDTSRSAGIQMCLLSNGRTRRIGKLASRLGLPYVGMAFKPFPFGCWKAMRQLDLRPERTAIVGDQVFADVMAGNLAGIFTILVRPSSLIEPWFTRLKRPLERRVLSKIDIQTLALRWKSAQIEERATVAADS